MPGELVNTGRRVNACDVHCLGNAFRHEVYDKFLCGKSPLVRSNDATHCLARLGRSAKYCAKMLRTLGGRSGFASIRSVVFRFRRPSLCFVLTMVQAVAR